MDVPTTEFEADLKAAGFVEIASKTWDQAHSQAPHAHPFFVKALVTQGEMTIRCRGEAQHCEAGDTFVMDAGTEHVEIVGSEGVTFVSGRKYPT